jgi:peptidoglycan L-alanyl-D-glutamate endopeptidase CwlK
MDFTVLEGLRTPQRQAELFRAGASKTMNSRHLTGHAVDLAPLVGGNVRWDWPLYDKLAITLLGAASALNIQLEWGGHWETFKDGPHFQLPWADYPK